MTGLIYAVIVVLWALVLVPMWLRKHDVTTETRSVDRFSTAMRTLSRRTPPSTRTHDVLMPARDNAPVVSGGRAPSAAARRAEAARQAAVRRRRTGLASVAGFLAVVVVATVVGVAPLWLPAVTLLGTVGYLRYLRVEAVRHQQMVRREQRRARASRPAPRPAAAEGSAARVERARTEAEADARTRAEDRADAAPQDPSAWEPTPVVLPTYVTKPPATSVPRRIDLTHGEWSAKAMLEHVSRRPDPDEVFDRTEEDRAAEVVAESEAGVTGREGVLPASAASAYAPIVAQDSVFDQEDEELLSFLERRAAGS